MQLTDLREYATRRGFQIYREYCDIGISGFKDDRPQLNALIEDARKGKFNAVMVWKFDRFARSSRHLINSLCEFNHLGIDFISFTENIDTSSPTGKVLFTIISAMAEFERDLIRQRVKAGLDHAKQRGVKLGRPSFLTENIREQIKELRVAGKSIRAIARQVKVSPSLVHKTLTNFKGSDVEKSRAFEGA